MKVWASINRETWLWLNNLRFLVVHFSIFCCTNLTVPIFFAMWCLIVLWLSAIVSSICRVSRGWHRYIIIPLGTHIPHILRLLKWLLCSTTSNRNSIIESIVMWNEFLADRLICVSYSSIWRDSLWRSSLPFVRIATWRISADLLLRARPKVAQDFFSVIKALS